MTKILSKLQKHHIMLAVILLLTFLWRFPSLFEPFWYGDEGIFAAVARNLNLGGVLYQDAWDNKPPMIYLTYQAIFNIFGVSMFWLRLITSVIVVSTAAVIYEIAEATLGKRRGVVAAAVFGFLVSLRIIEGNLALTEIFMILPISLAFMIAIKRNLDLTSLFVAGFLFAIASLYKQVGALEAGALGAYIFLQSRDFREFFKKGFALTGGFVLPFIITFLYFYPKGLFDDYIFAAYTYYQIYFEESPQYALLINISKILPAISAIGLGLYWKLKKKKISFYLLFFLWGAFSFLGSYFSGRTYGHYLIQAVPAISLLVASIPRKKISLDRVKIAFLILYFVPVLFLTRLLFSDFLSGGPINQFKYWNNFAQFASGNKSLNDYNDYFDSNVNTIMALTDSIISKVGKSKNIYVWGDLPWFYAIVDAKNPSKYVTSFHVFGVPDGKQEVSDALMANLPVYIIKPRSSIGYFGELEKLLSEKYTFLINVQGADIFVLD